MLWNSNLANALKETKVELAALHESANLVDLVWKERPHAGKSHVKFLSETYTGRSVAAKLGDVRAAVKEKGADAIVLTALDDIAWLFNIRGNDVEFNPVVCVACCLCATMWFSSSADVCRVARQRLVRDHHPELCDAVLGRREPGGGREPPGIERRGL